MKTRFNTTELAKIISNSLASYIPKPECLNSNLYDALVYSLVGNGKRLRPVMLMSIVQEYIDDPLDYSNFACALEYIHTYSLIHDDLPAMDNDDLRRGMPTVHKKFGEDIAILAGDALQSLAFCLISSNIQCDAFVRLQCTDILSKAAFSMVEGQIDDVLFDSSNVDVQSLLNIFEHKTAALFKAACEMGASIAKVDNNTFEMLSKFGLEFGLAFQIADDILDFEKNEDINICNILGLDGAKSLLEEKKQKLVKLNNVLKINNFNELIGIL